MVNFFVRLHPEDGTKDCTDALVLNNGSLKIIIIFCHTPHRHRGLIGHKEWIGNACILCCSELINPRMSTSCGCHVLRCNIVTKVPITRVRFAICRARGQAVLRQDTYGEEASTIVTPEILRKMARERPRGLHGSL